MSAVSWSHRWYGRAEWRRAWTIARAQRYGAIGHPGAYMLLLRYAETLITTDAIRAGFEGLDRAGVEAARELRRRGMAALTN